MHRFSAGFELVLEEGELVPSTWHTMLHHHCFSNVFLPISTQYAHKSFWWLLQKMVIMVSGFVLNQIRKQSGAQLQLLRDEVQSTRPCHFDATGAENPREIYFSQVAAAFDSLALYAIVNGFPKKLGAEFPSNGCE